MQFRQQLKAEFARRRQRNGSYSVRAFARDLITDHATLSQILRGRRPLSARMVALFGQRLGLSRAAIVDGSVEQHAEAILKVVRSGKYQPNSRWIATRTGIPVDSVNAALDRLVRHRQLTMGPRNVGKRFIKPMPNPVVRWQILSPEPAKTAAFYEKLFA